MFDSSVLAIRGVDKRIHGTAFGLLPRGMFVTCAHVVLDALRIPRSSADRPTNEIHLLSSLDQDPIITKLVAWSPPSGCDVAILEAVNPLPGETVALPLHEVSLSAGTLFQSYGFPENYHSQKYFGRLTQGEVIGTTKSGSFQLQAPDVTFGFSGGPLVEMQMGRVVGLLAAKDSPNVYAVPAAEIREIGEREGVTLECLRPARPFHLLTAGLEGLPDDLLSRCENLLNYYLGTASSPAIFGGRRREFDQLDNWLNSQIPCALIVEPAGRGKTALLTKWASQIATSRRADVAFVPVSNRFGTGLRDQMARIWSARLSYLDLEPGSKSIRSDPLGELMQRLRKPRAPGERMLIHIIDGLDEAVDWMAGLDLIFPSFPEQGTKFLISTRPVAGAGNANEWRDRLNWNRQAAIVRLGGLSRYELTEILALAPEWLQQKAVADVIYDLTDHGDPLLVRLIVEDMSLRDPIPVAQLTKEKPGYDGYFQRWWDDQQRAWKARGETEHRKSKDVRRALAAALGPMDKYQLALLVDGDPDDVEKAVAQFSRHVIGDSRKSGWVFSHPRLRDYFWEEMGLQLQQQWASVFLEYIRRAFALAEAKAPEKIHRYCVQFGSAHLVRSDVSFSEYAPMAREGWLRAWQMVDTITFTGYERDIGRAWSAAEQGNDLGGQLRCALITGMVRFFSGMPPQLSVFMLEEGLATPGEMLTLIRRADYQPYQAEWLQIILPALQIDSVLAEALAIAETLPPVGYTVTLMTALAQRLKGDLRMRAVETAHRIARSLDAEERVSALVSVSAVLPPNAAAAALVQAEQDLGNIERRMPSIKASIAFLHVAGADVLEKLFDKVMTNIQRLNPGDQQDTALEYLLTHSPKDLLTRLDQYRGVMIAGSGHFNDVLEGTLRRIRIVKEALKYQHSKVRYGLYSLYFDKLDRSGVRELVEAALPELMGPRASKSIKKIEAALGYRLDKMTTYTRIELIARGLDPQELHFVKVLESIPRLPESSRREVLLALATALPLPLNQYQYTRIRDCAASNNSVIPELCAKVSSDHRREAVLDAFRTLRQIGGMDQLLGRMALRLSPYLPPSRQPQTETLLGGVSDLWLVIHEAEKGKEFDPPPYLLNHVLQLVKGTSDLAPLAWLTTSGNVRRVLVDELRKASLPHPISTMVLLASIATGRKRGPAIRDAAAAIEQSKSVPRFEVLRLAEMMEREEALMFVRKHLLPCGSGLSDKSYIDSLEDLLRVFPECYEECSKAARGLGYYVGHALAQLAEMAPKHERLRLLHEILTYKNDKELNIIIRTKILQHSSMRHLSPSALPADWTTLDWRSLCTFAEAAQPILAVPDYGELLADIARRIFSAAGAGWQVDLKLFMPPLLRLIERDAAAGEQVVRILLRGLTGFTPGLMLDQILEIFPALTRIYGPNAATEIFDNVLEVRRWWDCSKSKSANA